jgi:hypothetical protein
MHFSYTDGVYPDSLSFRTMLDEIRIILSETLTHAIPPSATSLHAPKVIRGGYDKPKIEQDAVKPLHQCLAHCGIISSIVSFISRHAMFIELGVILDHHSIPSNGRR